MYLNVLPFNFPDPVSNWVLTVNKPCFEEMQPRWYLIAVLLVVNVNRLIVARKSDASVGLSDLFGRSSDDHRKPVFPGMATSYRSRIPKGRHNSNGNKDYSRESKLRKSFASKDRKPNIILILTDDQDVELRKLL